MKGLGDHLIVEFYGCNKEVINNEVLIENILIKAAKVAKATIIDYKFHKFSPHGVSGAIIIAESHFTIHTWPEYGYCAVDIFTCGDLINSSIALNIIKEGIEADYMSAIKMVRGLIDLPDDQIRHKPEGS